MNAVADRTDPPAGDALGTAEQTTGQRQGRCLVDAEPVSFHELHPPYHAGKGRVHLVYLYSLPDPPG